MTEPIDFSVDGGVDRDQQSGASYTQENGGARTVTGTSQVPTPSSHLPHPTSILLDTLDHFNMLSTSQLRRLHYQGTDRGTKARCSRHLKRLYDLGKLRRVRGIFNNGYQEYFYTLPDSTAKPDDHDLFGVELYVQLVETLGYEMDYEIEPLPRVGQVQLTPDAYLNLGPNHKFFIEIDLSSEKPARLRQKMKPYIHAFEDYWDEQKHDGKFPLVVWVVMTERRWRTLEAEIKKQPAPIFAVMLFDDVVRKLTKGLA